MFGIPLTPLPSIAPLPPSSGLSHLSPAPQLPAELDVATTQYLLHLSQLKAQAIDCEDYDAAKAMKERMERLLAEVPRLVEAERRKREAIEREDFDEAKRCKHEVEAVRERALHSARDAQPHGDERKDRGDASARKRPSRDAKVSLQDFPESSATPRTPALPSDDDRPIKPAKSAAAAAPASHDDLPVGRKKAAAASAPSADDEASFPVHVQSPADEKTAAVADASDAAAFAPSSNWAVYDEERPIRSKFQSPSQAPTEGVGSPRAAGDERAIAASNAAYPFDASSELEAGLSSSALPSAEPIPASLSKEAEPLIALFGSLLTSQLLSRHWQLRVEALGTVATLIADAASPVREGEGWVREVGRVLQRVLADKVVQVSVAAARLLELALQEGGKKAAGAKEELRGLVEAVTRVMVDRPQLLQRAGEGTRRRRSSSSWRCTATPLPPSSRLRCCIH